MPQPMIEEGLQWEEIGRRSLHTYSSEGVGDLAPLWLRVYRARVEGGWLVLGHTYNHTGHTMTFVSDPDHKWTCAVLPPKEPGRMFRS